MLSQQQFPGMESAAVPKPPPVDAAPATAAKPKGHTNGYALREQDAGETPTWSGEHWIDEYDGSVLPSKGPLPLSGTVSTDELDIPMRVTPSHIPFNGSPPLDVSYHNTTKSGHNKGDLREVPIASASDKWPAINTLQFDVSASRLHQMADHPETRSTPRIPASLGRDLPVAWQESKDTTPVLLDGNHRTVRDMLGDANGQMQMFSQMRVITPENHHDVVEQSHKIARQRNWSQYNKNRNPHATWDALAQDMGTSMARNYGNREEVEPGDIHPYRGPRA